MVTTVLKNSIKNWLADKLEIGDIPTSVIAINFGIQKVYDGYELYLKGCDEYYEEHDTWLQNEIYEPKDNFINLGTKSLELTETDIYSLYKSEVLNLLKSKNDNYIKHLKYITMTYFNGQPERLRSDK